MHVAVPRQAPLQPLNDDPEAGAAVSVTTVPLANEAEQVEPHSIPGGLLVTVPAPGPALVTVKAYVGAKVAVTNLAAVMLMVQVPVPAQAPPQPANVEPTAAVAVKVTLEPFTNDAAQVGPQEIPAGLLVTVPAPLPCFVTVNETGGAVTVTATTGD